MNEEEQNDAVFRQSPDDELGGDESSGGQPGDERSLLTAYALGELDDVQRAEIESRLRESTDQRQAVDDLARLGKLLRSVAAQSYVIHTSSTPVDRSSELREALLARLADPPQRQAPLGLSEKFPRRRFWLPLSLAAALAVTCGALFALMKTKHGEQVAAQPTANSSSAAETEGLDTLTDLTEMGMADLSIDSSLGHEVKLNKKSAEGRTGDGEAPYSDLSVAEIRRRLSTGAEPDPQEMDPNSMLGARGEMMRAQAAPGGGPSVKFAEGMQQTASPARDRGGYAQRGRVGLSGRRSNAGKPAASSYETVPPPDAKPSFGELSRGGRNGGGEDEAKQNPRSYDGMSLGEGQQDLQTQQIAAEGEARERINRELFLQQEREGGGRSGNGQRSNAQGKNTSGQPGNAYFWFDQRGATPGGPAGMGMGGGTGTNGAMGGGLLVGGRGLPETLARESQLYAAYGGMAGQNTESYPALVETPFRKPTEYPLSTFSIDVDTASYTNVRRFLNSRAMPPRDAVRVEELINYFQYNYLQPDGDLPFSITTDVADCPWQAQHRLLRVGLKGREIPADQRPASNLVFLLDVSGSMDAPNKLPLVKEAMSLLVDKLTENDRVAIVVYAGNSGLVLPPTNGQDKATIRAAISGLVAGGSTNGGQGLQMAYDTAQAHFIKGGTNRVILATDGDFNVGIVDQNDLVRLIEEKATGGVFLSALGFGIGNLKDGTLEKLADKGNGNYAYIDTAGEARRVLVDQLSGTLVTIAKDVKLQIEFNPAQAAEYRLVGYEDRLMPDQDFHDDRKDAGEIGAGHSVTALYEIVPAAVALAAGGEPLKYQRSETANRATGLTAAAATGELATIKLRYKEPDGQQSRLIERVVTDRRPPRAEASRDMSFAAAVAAFGMLLRDSPYRGEASYQKVLSLAEQGLTGDATGYRSEFVQLVRQAREISGKE